MTHTLDSPLIESKIDLYLDEILPTRQVNYFERNGQIYLRQVLNMRMAEVQQIKNWGKVCTRVLLDGLTTIGLKRLWPAKRNSILVPSRPILQCPLGLFHIHATIQWELTEEDIDKMPPCHHPPGTLDRIDLLQERAAKGLPLHIKKDHTVWNVPDEYNRPHIPLPYYKEPEEIED